MVALRPGSSAWLFRHEWRLHYRGLRFSAWVGAAAFLAGIIQLVGLALGYTLAESRLPVADQLATANATLLLLGLLMLSSAFGVVIEALFTRRDLEWLLTSPLPFRRILRVRMAAMAAGCAWFWLLLLGAVANGAAIFGQPRWLAAYPVLCALAMAATAVATALTITIMPMLGLRRTRAVASGLAVLVGAMPFLFTQMDTVFGQGSGARFWRAMAPRCCGIPPGVGWWPARAMLGSPAPLAAVALAGLGGAVVTGWVLERRFAAGAIVGAPRGRAGAAGAGAPKFGGSLRAALRRKELRLLARTPGLLGTILQKLIYMVPLALTLLRPNGPSAGLVAFVVATLPIFAADQLAQTFGAIASSADLAAELAHSAPVPQRAVRLAKLEAAAIATTAVLALPMLFVAARLPGAVPALLTGMACAALAELLVTLWFPMPWRRSDLGAPQPGAGGPVMLSLANVLVWSVATWFLLRTSAWAVMPVAVAVGGLLALKPAPRWRWP